MNNNRFPLDLHAAALLDDLTDLSDQLHEIAHSNHLRRVLSDNCHRDSSERNLDEKGLEEQVSEATHTLAEQVIAELRQAIRHFRTQQVSYR